MHGRLGCVTCHAGNSEATTKEAAHQGFIAQPSKDADKACGTCHGDKVKTAATSLHATQNGYWTYLQAVGADVKSPVIRHAFEKNCAECHTTCGQCHVSRPAFSGGGFVAGHAFKKSGTMKDTCVLCHGARIGDEFLGNYDFIPGDVHASKANMDCHACHKGASVHGDGTVRANMFERPEATCVKCHERTLSDGKITQHVVHKGKLACQVCHAVAYKNCKNCHVGTDAKGLPFRTLDPSWLDFKIGRNPAKTAERPYEYVVVRHVPTNADLFKAYGVVFPNPNAVSSWRPTTPHNIQRKTVQNASCDACHGNAKLFLTSDKVDPNELEANRNVIVDKVPTKRGP